jgi:hypothetical protein
MSLLLLVDFFVVFIVLADLLMSEIIAQRQQCHKEHLFTRVRGTYNSTHRRLFALYERRSYCPDFPIFGFSKEPLSLLNNKCKWHIIYLTTEAKGGKMFEYIVDLKWDSDADVWVATSDDIPGLVLESGSVDALIERVRFAAPELLSLNGTIEQNLNVCFKSERHEKVAL